MPQVRCKRRRGVSGVSWRLWRLSASCPLRLARRWKQQCVLQLSASYDCSRRLLGSGLLRGPSSALHRLRQPLTLWKERGRRKKKARISPVRQPRHGPGRGGSEGGGEAIRYHLKSARDHCSDFPHRFRGGGNVSAWHRVGERTEG
ncbi:hypothetical protein MATL_G00058160 [Megalops atlanticus]|uniref:Uncharacterized protein n=1 Tax=Megalops atlanticus TaxID=7932 RepID=A0A9D3Q872_MEGAT|nr:hypothetical protein MATL_G00058160 [Megalops atlanticus]